MKTLIAWSGETSKEVAYILNSWLPLMNPQIQTFFSAEDITTGTPWYEALHRNVVECDCAIFCLTSGNIHSPWLYYEAGMVHNTKNVISVLFDVSSYQLDGPFRYFKEATFDKDSLWRVAGFLNDLCGQNALSTKELHKKFEELYPIVEKMLAQVRVSRKERLQESQSKQSAGDLRQDFATVNSKLDAILSRLSQPVSSPRQENSL